MRWGLLEMSDKKKKAIQFIQESIDRNTAKMPRSIRRFQGEFKVGYCPSCPMGVNSEMEYCISCGQRLKWGG